MSFIASSCALNVRIPSTLNVETPVSALSNMTRHEGRKTSSSTFSQELEKERERVVKNIYKEDQKEIDGLQTTAQKRKNVQKLVDEFIKEQEMETRIMIHQKQLYNYKYQHFSLLEEKRGTGQRENGKDTMACQPIDTWQNIRLELFKNKKMKTSSSRR